MQNLPALIAAIGALAVAITSLVAVLKGFKSAATDRAAASAKLDEVHAAVTADGAK